MDNGGGSPTFTDCAFTGNSVATAGSSNHGGAIYSTSSTVTLTSCHFEGNVADGVVGRSPLSDLLMRRAEGPGEEQ